MRIFWPSFPGHPNAGPATVFAFCCIVMMAVALGLFIGEHLWPAVATFSLGIVWLSCIALRGVDL